MIDSSIQAQNMTNVLVESAWNRLILIPVTYHKIFNSRVSDYVDIKWTEHARENNDTMQYKIVSTHLNAIP